MHDFHCILASTIEDEIVADDAPSNAAPLVSRDERKAVR